MADRPLAPLLAELGMRLLNRVVLVPLRRLLIGEDAWTDFYECGHDGHPWWHYQQGPDGRLELVGPIGRRPPRPAPPAPLPAPRPRGSGAGVAVPLSGGRLTTPIPDYQPALHGAAVDALDLLCTLLDAAAGVAPPGAGRPVGSRRSISLAAREWGTRTGRTQRGADRCLAQLGAEGILVRSTVGSRAEWHLPADALARFEARHGFSVAD